MFNNIIQSNRNKKHKDQFGKKDNKIFSNKVVKLHTFLEFPQNLDSKKKSIASDVDEIDMVF